MTRISLIQPDIAEIKTAAAGRWPDVFRKLAPELTEALDANGRHVRCPLPNHEDKKPSFRIDKPDEGRAICSCGSFDAFQLLQRLRGWQFSESVSHVAKVLGIDSQNANGRHRGNGDPDLITLVCRQKCMPIESARAYGAHIAKRGNATVVRFPVVNERGEHHSHFDLTTDGGKGLFDKGKGKAGLFFPFSGNKPQLPRAGETWIVCEGCKDAAAYYGLRYLACGTPSDQLAVKYSRLFRGVHVIIMPDRTVDAERKASVTASRLFGMAASVRVGVLPLPIGGDKGDDCRDVLRLADGERLLRQAVDDAIEWKPAADESAGLPVVLVGLDEAAAADQVVDALATLGWRKGDDEKQRTYQRGGQLVHVVNSPAAELAGVNLPAGTIRIRTLPRAVVRERISSATNLYVATDHKPKRTRPPEWLSKAVYDRGEWAGVRPLAGIVRCPTLRPDGTVLQTAGYDPTTGLLYEPDGAYPKIDETPTRDDAMRSAAELLEVVCDFPFANDEHKTVWLALVLSLIGRPAIGGCCPLFTIDANTRGSGKSLLCDLGGLIAFGSKMPRKAWPRDDDETRKVITSVALEAIPAVLWDNVSSMLGSSSFDAALTGTTWTDRVLGRSETTGTLPLTTVWLATGNNLCLGADTARRTLYCRLESMEENPEDRHDFQHPNLLRWVREHRHRLATAAVTVLRSYIAEGKPDQGLLPWGSFEAWTELIRGSIVWCGLPDPCGTRSVIRDADHSAELLRLLLDGIQEADTGDGVTAADIVRLLSHPIRADENDSYPTLRTAINEVCDKATSRKIGYKLRSFAGRVCGGRRLVKRPGRGGISKWTIEKIGCDSGDGCDVSAPNAGELLYREQKVTAAETSQPLQPSQPCDHLNPSSWVHRENVAYCPGCDRFMGRAT